MPRRARQPATSGVPTRAPHPEAPCVLRALRASVLTRVLRSLRALQEIESPAMADTSRRQFLETAAAALGATALTSPRDALAQTPQTVSALQAPPAPVALV